MANKDTVLENLNIKKVLLDSLTLFFAKNLIYAFLILKPVLIKVLGRDSHPCLQMEATESIFQKRLLHLVFVKGLWLVCL